MHGSFNALKLYPPIYEQTPVKIVKMQNGFPTVIKVFDKLYTLQTNSPEQVTMSFEN
jgi:hypothetical protein